MSSGRDKVKLSEEEVQGLLEENLKVQVAANGVAGFPHLTTLFYVVRDGKIAFWTYGRSQKILNLERDPRVTALVEDGTDYFELRGVSIEGRAEIVRDHDTILEIGSAVATRMVGADSFESLGEIGMKAVEKQATKRVGVVIHPERVASWDHRKMTGG
ncbi:pyridoxamine 5'-phosphate oxidase family protein [Nocardioides daeguensis]|uniref:PPOX class F420-dependent oxidoreductase n=1 Tax=Nocardioides daeguensis TaxID=908359 RepID=A0ABP6UV78_9ACTN|nr:pyridoxamine 5'-phosphate oxidase family protein [Nocardioides daeguensis]MBV6725504.1 pyridoxamine 5'-phosphate oxidase family protein [Nocardioides daeguensis]MCR1771364.1 pyridoxamine 5'-phosphate oxidase family protein [Nocardioides daeguensis]